MMAHFADMHPDLWKKMGNAVPRQCLDPERFARLAAYWAKTGDQQLPATEGDELEDDAPVGVGVTALRAEVSAAAFSQGGPAGALSERGVLRHSCLRCEVGAGRRPGEATRSPGQNDATIETVFAAPEDARRAKAAFAEVSTPETTRDELVA
jgi:hypothetical protein